MASKSLKSEAPNPGAPKVGAAQLRLLERLCTASGVSGDEGAVRKIVLDEIRPYVSELRVDALGNVLARRPGEHPGAGLRVMLAAHMDEVGFMIVQDEEQGIFRFDTVGSIDARQLVGKPVHVGRERVPGVIGSKPIHLTTAEERKQPLTLEVLRIDVGPENARRVKVGDWAAYATPFERLGPSLRAKALDDRLGVASLIELVKHAPGNIDLLAAFTVQEEIGGRGARVAAYAFDPHMAFVLDCTPAHDLPPWNAVREYSSRDYSSQEYPAPSSQASGKPSTSVFTSINDPENTRYNTKLGSGPAIYVADSATLSDPRLVRHVIETAEALKIPYQIRQPGGGGTDAGAIHQGRAGIPSLSISVPGRYLHTAVSLCRLDDWKNTLALVHAALSRLSPELLDNERGS